MSARPYRVRFTGAAVRSLARLDSDRARQAVVAYITERLVHDPWRMSKPLHGPLVDYRTAQPAEGYRVRLHIDDATRTVYVDHVAHRSDSYRT